MTSSKKIALVTGANRGIGFEASRQLAKNGFKVILTARHVELGLKATATLKAEGLDVDFHALDVTSEESIHQLGDFVAQKLGRLDVLVNNAGIAIDSQRKDGVRVFASAFTAKIETIRQSFETNTLGAFLLCQKLIPVMQKNNYGRVVNVSSGKGQLSDMGGASCGYRISKVALNAVTKIFAFETKDSNILINSMCPGWVKTDMGGDKAPRTPEKGAETIVWLATLPDNGPTGKFFRDKEEISW